MRARAEKVARIAEIEFGHAPTIGRFQRAVKKSLEIERPDIARFIDGEAEPLNERPVLGPDEMSQGERVGIDPRVFRSLVFEAYCEAEGEWRRFAKNLDGAGFTIACGDKTTLVMDEATGYYISLVRILASESKSAGRQFHWSGAEIREVFGRAEALKTERVLGFDRARRRAEAAVAFEIGIALFEALSDSDEAEFEDLQEALRRRGSSEEHRKMTLKAQRDAIRAAENSLREIRLQRMDRVFRQTGTVAKPDNTSSVFAMAEAGILMTRAGVASAAVGIAGNEAMAPKTRISREALVNAQPHSPREILQKPSMVMPNPRISSVLLPKLPMSQAVLSSSEKETKGSASNLERREPNGVVVDPAANSKQRRKSDAKSIKKRPHKKLGVERD
jgi:hypothetical protein